MNGFDFGDPGSDPSVGGFNLNSWTGTGGTGPGSMYVLPGEGGGERAETGLTVPTDNSGFIGETGLPPGITPGTPGSGWGNPDTGFFSTIKDLFSGAGYGGQLGQLAAFGGLAALLNKFAGQQSQQPVGYQGGIPEFTVSRQQLPYVSGAENEARRLKQATLDALSTGATLDQVAGAAQRTYGISPGQVDAAMRTEGPYRRPGLGGITYFTPTQYTATGRDLSRPTAGQVFGGGDSNVVNPGIVSGIGGLGPVEGGSTTGLLTTPTKQTAQQVKPQPYSNYQVAQAIYDVLNPAGGGLGTLAQARQGAANLGVTGAQFEASLMPRLSQAIREAQAQMPSATMDQIRAAAMRRYGIDADTFNKAAALNAPSDAQIKEMIRANIQKPQEVAWLANTYGLNTKRLSDITGFTEDQVKSYFADNKVGLPTAAPSRAPTTAPAPAPSKFSDEQVASAIRESLRNKFDPQQTLNKAAALGATADQLARAAAALNQSGYTGITSPAKFSDAQVASAIKTSLQEKYDPQEVLNRARDLGATTDQLERSVAALTESGYKGLKMPTEAPAAPKYTDEQVSSAIRQSLIDGFSAEATLKRAEELGATADQIVRARAALKESGYAGGGYMPGGIAMLAGGRYLRGPGDGVSDSIPAKFEQSGQPARLADGEFVIDARTVSEIGNGSSEAGARKLYAMMDRVHAARKKAQRGKPSGADKFLPK